MGLGEEGRNGRSRTDLGVAGETDWAGAEWPGQDRTEVGGAGLSWVGHNGMDGQGRKELGETRRNKQGRHDKARLKKQGAELGGATWSGRSRARHRRVGRDSELWQGWTELTGRSSEVEGHG